MGDDLVARVSGVLDATGLKANELAAQIGLDPSKFSKSMNGKRNFTSLELALIAEAGETTVDWLLTGRAQRRWQVAARATVTAVTDVQRTARSVVSNVADRFDALRSLGFAQEIPPLPTVPSAGRYLAQAELAARAARKQLEPLSLTGTATATLIGEIEVLLGVNVTIVELPEGIDGLSYQDGEFRLIVLAQTSRYARLRYTLAHELGHLLFGDAEESLLAETLFAKVGGGTKDQEARSNAFAASFLMPEDEVLQVLAGRAVEDAFDDLAWEFWASPESMAWRLHNLGLIDAETREHLGVRSGRGSATRLGRSREFLERSAQAENPRSPWWLVNEYLGAYSLGEVTLRPVADLLQQSLEQTEDFFGEAEAQ